MQCDRCGSEQFTRAGRDRQAARSTGVVYADDASRRSASAFSGSLSWLLRSSAAVALYRLCSI